MKKLYFLYLLLGAAFSGHTQNLVNSRKTSFYTYIFKITNQEARQLYRKDLDAVKDSFFHTVVDSFPTAQTYPKPLPVGHYLITYAEEDQLVYKLQSVGYLQVKLLNNKNDLAIHLHDSLGRPVTDARVRLKKSSISYDAKTGAYRLRNTHRQGLLAVEYRGIISYHCVTDPYKTRRLTRIVNRIFFGFPLGYITRPFRDIYAFIKDGYATGFVYYVSHPAKWWHDRLVPRFSRNYTGFIVFNKPRYRAQDTVRLKAVLFNSKGEPTGPKLDVVLEALQFSSGKPVTLTRLAPYRKGCYEYAFILHDSLKLRLGSNCRIVLRKKNKEYLSGNFKYEDYELKSNTFVIRNHQKEYTQGEKVMFFAKGTDENDRTVMDARIELMLFPKSTSQFPEQQVIVRDTLWRHQQKLDALGETRITVPDSIFPNATIDYRLEAVFLTADNERHSRSLDFSRSYTATALQLRLQNDSLVATYEVKGISQSHQAQLIAYADEDKEIEIFRKKVALPHREPVNPYVYAYELSDDKNSTSLEIETQSAGLQVYNSRTPDSVRIQIDNPKKLPFWYTIYRKNRRLASGHQRESLDYQHRATRTQKYFASVQYIWNNQVHEEEYEIPLFTRQLQIETNQPLTVSPGQTVPIWVRVRDIDGKPVANADVTAYGATKKFPELHAPSVPDFSKQYRSRKLINTFQVKERFANATSRQQLQWQRWHQEMGLDRIAYFQFLYPRTGLYKHYLPVDNGLTQIAPFVVQNGVIQTIHLLFVDDEPVYFQVAEAGQRYSFHLSAGYHRLRIRTQNLTINLDSVYLKPGHKLILGVDPDSFYQPKKPRKAVPVFRPAPDSLRRHAHIVSQAPVLSASERAVFNRYLMPIRRNFGSGSYTYLHQNKQIFMLHNPEQQARTYLIGPVKPQMLYFVQKASFSTDFVFEPYFEYEFLPHLLKMRTWTGNKQVVLFNQTQKIVPRFDEKAWTAQEIDSLYQQSLDKPVNSYEYYNNPQQTDPGNGRLLLRARQPNPDLPAIRFWVLFAADKQEFIRVYPGSPNGIHNLAPGMYHLVGLSHNDEYLTVNDIRIRANAATYYRIPKTPLSPADAYSRQLRELVKKRITVHASDADQKIGQAKPVMKTIYPSQEPSGNFNHYVQGRITSETGDPLSGVSIVIKGTTKGTVTDGKGFYQLYTTRNATLVFSFIGYMTEEVVVGNQSGVDKQLVPDVQALSEVVVVGYGIQKRSAMTGSVSIVSQALQGRVAGVVVTSSGERITLRGVSSISASQRPLIIIDGVPYEGADDIDPQLIASAQVLKGETAIALYGSRGANGVVIITTKQNSIAAKAKTTAFPDIASADAAGSIRSRFSDYAFWQPKLRTDKKGEVTFNATFPDDITNWRTFVVAVGNQKKTGLAEGSIKAFKTVAGTLAVPRFLVQGDTAQVVGKALNYTSDTLDLQTTFIVNEKIVSRNRQKVADVLVDSVMVTASQPDSLKIKYLLQKTDGYTDGELRPIPVFPVGITETKGQFLNLEKDTTVQLRFDPSAGKVKLYARDQVLDILLDEIGHLHQYAYLCNEQVASKIKAYLADKRIRAQLHQPFVYENDLRRLIRRLEEHQKKEGAWSWWKEGPGAVWVTTHVVEALLQARQAGYPVPFKQQDVIDHFVFQLAKPSVSFDERIRMLRLLKQLNASVDFRQHVAALDTFFIPKKPTVYKNALGYRRVVPPPKPTLHQFMQRMELQQALGLTISLDTILRTRQSTMLGSSYWGEEDYRPFVNEIQTTLLVYRMLKTHGGFAAELTRIRNYFFEKRRTGYWRNTYESAHILETILPDLLGTETVVRKPQLVIQTGGETQTIKDFPFEMEATAHSTLKIEKTGTLPVYLTGYQQFHNPAPVKVEKDFIVTTRFKGFGSTQQTLKKGEKVTLQVSVEVIKDADYVVVEVPIPAGCSYGEDSPQPWFRNGYETYREPFRHKTAIYCTQLPKGRYTFDIQLVPRYNGVYTLNPAKAELMYFPTFFGRNELQQVRIK